MNYCTLSADINGCQYYKSGGEGICCGGPAECTFFKYREEDDEFAGFYKYVREPRWYEKYYNINTAKQQKLKRLNINSKLQLEF